MVLLLLLLLMMMVVEDGFVVAAERSDLGRVVVNRMMTLKASVADFGYLYYCHYL